MALQENQGQFVLHFRQDGDPDDYICVIAFNTTGGTNGPNAADAAILFDAFQPVLDNLSIALHLVQVDMEMMTATGITKVVDTGDLQGNITGQSLLQNTAYLIHKNTAAAGAGGQGRMYLPGVADDDVSNVGVVDLDRVAAMNAGWSTFYDTTNNDLSVSLGVNHGPGSPHGLFSGTLSYTCDALCASQRRRLRK